MEIIQEIGSYAGFAAVVGLAILSALYFSQARDVRRLRDWAGRAPERAAEIDSGGRAAAAVPVAARPQPQVRQPAEGAAAATAGAAPATASAGAPAATDADEAAEAEEAVPVGAAAGDGATNGDDAVEEDVEGADEDVEDEAERPAGAPAAATAAGAVASAAGTADRPAATAGTAVAEGEGTAPSSDTGTGAKVLPARRPAPPIRPRPTIPPTRTIPPRPGQTSVLSSQTGVRPPARRGRNWPAPRYIALIVAGVVILGLGGTVGVLQLTKEDEEPSGGGGPPVTDVEDPTRATDRPEPTPRIDPATIRVAVLNATSTTGLAARIGSRLDSAGFQTGNLTNAAERARTESVVMFKPDKNNEARTVARRLDIGSIEPIDAQAEPLAGDADVVVVLGADKAQQ